MPLICDFDKAATMDMVLVHLLQLYFCEIVLQASMTLDKTTLLKQTFI